MFENNEDPLWYQWGMIFVFIASWVASIAILIWCLIILHKDWYKTYIVKRHRILVILLLILLFSGNLISTSLWIPARFFTVMRKLAYDIRFFAEAPIVLMTWVLVIVREWLLYYDMEHYRHIKNCSWKSKINIHSVTNHWTVVPKVKATVGNPKFLVIFIAISSYVVALLLYLIRHVWFDYFEFLLATAVYLLSWSSFGIYVAYLMNKMKFNYKYDKLGIRKELILYVKFLCTFGIALLILAMLRTHIFGIHTGSERRNKRNFTSNRALDLIEWILLCSTYLICMVISLPYVQHYMLKQQQEKLQKLKKNSKLKQINNLNVKIEPRLGSISSNSLSIKSIITNHNSNNNNNAYDEQAKRIKKWNNFVSTSVGYEAFINHLEQEFALENLAFVTEYAQVKHVLIKHFKQLMNELMSDATLQVGFNLDLPNKDDSNTIPKSLIAAKLDDMIEQTMSDKSDKSDKNDKINNSASITIICDNTQQIKDICYIIIDSFVAIYTKYIKTSAELEINISSQQRDNLRMILDLKYYYQIESKFQSKSNTSSDIIQKSNSLSNSIKTKIQQIRTVPQLQLPKNKHVQSTLYNYQKHNNDNNSNEFVDHVASVTEEKQSLDRHNYGNQELKRENNKENDVFAKLKNAKLDRVLIHDQLDKQLKQAMSANSLGNSDEQETKVMKWLLVQLMYTTERAVIEISRLMHQSFLRFRTQEDFIHVKHQLT